jgi:hypothetical protein
MSIHSKPSNADGHSEGQTRTARETIHRKKETNCSQCGFERVKSEAEDKIPGENGGERCSAPAGYAEKHPPFPRVVSLVVVILFRTLPERGRFELALRSLHLLTISNRTYC